MTCSKLDTELDHELRLRVIEKTMQINENNFKQLEGKINSQFKCILIISLSLFCVTFVLISDRLL